MNQNCAMEMTVAEAEYIIIILTGGILEDSKCLSTLKNILEKLENKKGLGKNSNIIFVMSKIDGWVFHESKLEKEAKDGTAKEVRKMLKGHEVMNYRPKGGKRNYEHESMMLEMMKRFKLVKNDKS